MQLRNFQKTGIEAGLSLKQVYFAIDMGMGKTAIILHIIKELRLPALVAAPLLVAKHTWPDEIKDWRMQSLFTAHVLHGAEKAVSFSVRPGTSLVHIINYEGLLWLYKKLYTLKKKGVKIPYKILILDESTLFKNPLSKRFGILCALRDLFPYIMLLSGTPAPNSLMDLWSQYFILDKGESLGKDYRSFRAQYFEPDPYRPYVWNLRFGAESAIHKRIAARTFRLQADDYIDLPERIYNKIGLELSPAEEKQYKSFKKDFVLVLEKAKVESLNEASLNSKLRQFIQGFVYESTDDGGRLTHFIHDHKINALRELVEVSNGKSIICLIQYKYEVEMILKAFPSTPFITGSTDRRLKDQYIEDFVAQKIPLLVAHPRSIGRGLNLQKGGHNLLWYAIPYSLDDYLQTNKRLHRSGQKETVVINHLVMRNTLDERATELLQTKGMTQQRLLDFLRYETRRLYNV